MRNLRADPDPDRVRIDNQTTQNGYTLMNGTESELAGRG